MHLTWLHQVRFSCRSQGVTKISTPKSMCLPSFSLHFCCHFGACHCSRSSWSWEPFWAFLGFSSSTLLATRWALGIAWNSLEVLVVFFWMKLENPINLGTFMFIYRLYPPADLQCKNGTETPSFLLR